MEDENLGNAELERNFEEEVNQLWHVEKRKKAEKRKDVVNNGKERY